MCVFPYVFQYFLKIRIFASTSLPEASWDPICANLGRQKWSRAPQERPKKDPRAAKSGPRVAQERPKSSQERPKSDQERPKSGQETPKGGQEQPRWAQERPRGAQERPRGARSDPKLPKSQPRAAQEQQKVLQAADNRRQEAQKRERKKRHISGPTTQSKHQNEGIRATRAGSSRTNPITGEIDSRTSAPEHEEI